MGKNCENEKKASNSLHRQQVELGIVFNRVYGTTDTRKFLVAQNSLRASALFLMDNISFHRYKYTLGVTVSGDTS